MARDNGKRGSYRHVSGSLAKAFAMNKQNEAKKTSEADKENVSPTPPSPADSVATPIINEKLARAKIGDDWEMRMINDRRYFFDSVPSSINEKYPIMECPGSMPPRMATPETAARDEPTWAQMAFLVALLGVAMFGFGFTVYMGVRDIVLYVDEVFGELIDAYYGV